MGIMVYSLLWVMQDFVYQPYLQFSTAWIDPPKTISGQLPMRDSRGLEKEGFLRF